MNNLKGLELYLSFLLNLNFDEQLKRAGIIPVLFTELYKFLKNIRKIT